MTVLPFTTRAAAREGGVDDSATPDVVGHFTSPGGGHGHFTGTYRLERLLDQYGQTAAAGVFTGELIGANRERIGLASRRHVAAAEVAEGPNDRHIGLGPVDVNLLGFLVTVEAFTVALPRNLPATGTSGRFPRTAAELLGLVVVDATVDATAEPDPAHPRRDDRGP